MTYSEPSLPNLPIFTTQSMLTLNSKKKFNLKKLLPFLRLLDKALYIVRLGKRNLTKFIYCFSLNLLCVGWSVQTKMYAGSVSANSPTLTQANLVKYIIQK